MSKFICMMSLAAASVLCTEPCMAQSPQAPFTGQPVKPHIAHKRDPQPDFLRYDDEKFPISRNLRGRISDLDTDVDEPNLNQDGIWLN